jgi:hypothetical protein
MAGEYSHEFSAKVLNGPSRLIEPELASNGGVPMRDDTSSRWASARKLLHRLWVRDRLPTAYGLAIAIVLRAALWAIIIGTALFLL